MSTTKNFEEFKKNMQETYAQMSDGDKAVYWEQSVYHVYKDKQLPTSASDKMIFDKLQNMMEIKATDEIQQQVCDLMASSLKSRQQAVYQRLRTTAQEKAAFKKILNQTVTSRTNDIG